MSRFECWLEDQLEHPIRSVVFLGLLVIAGIVAWLSVTHPCEAGHYERVFVAGHVEKFTSYEPSFDRDGGGRLASRPVWIPDHDENRWVCDEPSPARHWCRGRETIQLGSTAQR